MLMNTSTRLQRELSGNNLLLVFSFDQFGFTFKICSKSTGTKYRCYMKLHDSPAKTSMEENDEMSKLPPAQRKKLRQKQKKAEARAKRVILQAQLWIKWL
jgi:hypothetical protein